jgi:hypothetical protein
MKNLGRFAGLLVLFAAGASASVPSGSRALKLDELGKLKVGDSMERFPEIAKERARCRDSERAGAAQYVYYFSDALPKRCMNLECGPFAHRILSQGGRVVGGADPAFAEELGITGQHGSLLVVSDRDGKVRAIFRDVGRREIAAAVASLR